MDTLLLEDKPTVETLVETAYRSGQPVAVKDGADDCLVVMTPAVFEHILFDTAVLNMTDRRAFRL